LPGACISGHVFRIGTDRSPDRTLRRAYPGRDSDHAREDAIMGSRARAAGLAAVCAAALSHAAAAAPTARAAAGCSRYASPNGSDAAAGTRRHPFRTAQRLVDSLRPGQRGCLVHGVYRGEVRISHGGTGRGGRIVLTSLNPTNRATIAGLVYVPAGSNWVSVSHLRLNGRNGGELPSPIVDGDHVTFAYDNVTNRNTQSVCFIVGSATDRSAGFVAAYDRVHNCGDMRTRRDLAGDPHTGFYEHAFYVQNATRFRITQTIMFTISGRCVQLYPDATDGEVDRNLCDGAGTGVIVDSASSNVLITRNIFTNAVVQGGIAEGSTFAGSGDVAEQNVLWHDHPSYYQIRGPGFTVARNHLVPPMYRNRAARRYRLRRGSPAAGFGPARIQPRSR
jgi:hypothetical protein